jgi:dolichol-phosphate mannosyltransferase
VIPTYNERENLPLLVEKIREHAPQLDLLVVDDNSPDGTGQLAEDLGRASNARLAVLHRPRKEGLGRAYVAGFQHALARGYDTIVQMDADLSHDPSFLPAFLEKIRDADVVLGSRYLHGIAVVNWDFKRLLLSKAATAYVRLVTGMPFTDLTGGFKCWRREALEAIGLDRVFANGYLFQVETTYRAWSKGFRIAEVPIIFFERNLGRSKMDVAIIWEALWGVIRLRLRRPAGPKALPEGRQERR